MGKKTDSKKGKTPSAKPLAATSASKGKLVSANPKPKEEPEKKSVKTNGKKAIDPKKDFFTDDEDIKGKEEAEFVEEAEIEFIDGNTPIEDINSLEDGDDDDFYDDDDF